TAFAGGLQPLELANAQPTHREGSMVRNPIPAPVAGPSRADRIIPSVTRGYARYVLGVMVAINFLNYMDRYVGAAASPLIQKEFGLSDSAVGLLGSVLLLVYAIDEHTIDNCSVLCVDSVRDGVDVSFLRV